MLSVVTVHGQVFRPDGVTPERGEIVFILDEQLADTSTGEVVGPTQQLATLDGNGEFTVDLVATDDPDANPQGVRYRIRQRFSLGKTVERLAEVPAANPSIEFGALTLVEDERGDETYSWIVDGGSA